MSQDTDLGDVARAGLDDAGFEGGANQGMLEGTNFTKIGFRGVSYDALETDPKIGDAMSFIVRGRVVDVGDRLMADSHVQHRAQIDVSSVLLLDDNDNVVETGH